MTTRLATKAPVVRQISVRGIVTALAGPEPPYPVYRFGKVVKYEKPKHNPFQGL